MTMIDEEKLLRAVSERTKRHGNIVVTLDLLESILREAANPCDYSYQPPALPKLQLPRPEFPKSKIRLDDNKQIVERKVIYNHAEEQALRKSGQPWYTWEEG
jgi:hypothetical protein